MATAIMTDTNSGMTVEEADRLGVTLAPMPFIVDGRTYHEGIDLPRERFFQLLQGGADVSTSQVEPGNLILAWEDLLRRPWPAPTTGGSRWWTTTASPSPSASPSTTR